jgi:acetylornithine/N-succinyldiaminopimelate aminotransferase
VVADVRGEGLLLGLVAACPNGELVNAMRVEKLLAVAAGDNVVRLLPPLIIEAPEIADAVDRIDRAAERIERAQREKERAIKEAAGVNS